MRLWVIVYDIADEERRRRLARRLGRQLERVQESVFEGWLNPRELRELLAEIGELIVPAVDSVRAYPLTLRQPTRRQSLGDQPAASRPRTFWIV